MLLVFQIIHPLHTILSVSLSQTLTQKPCCVELNHLRRRLGGEAARQQPRLPPLLRQVLERLRVRLHQQPGPVVPVCGRNIRKTFSKPVGQGLEQPQNEPVSRYRSCILRTIKCIFSNVSP